MHANIHAYITYYQDTERQKIVAENEKLREQLKNFLSQYEVSDKQPTYACFFVCMYDSM